MRACAIILTHLLFTLACPAASAASDDAAVTSATPIVAGPAVWEYRLAPDTDGKGATLTLGPLTVEFDGEALAGTWSGSVQLLGGGSGQSQSGDLLLCSTESRLRVSFRGKSLTVTRADAGLRVRIGGDASVHDLPGSTSMTIRFARNGAATVRSGAP